MPFITNKVPIVEFTISTTAKYVSFIVCSRKKSFCHNTTAKNAIHARFQKQASTPTDRTVSAATL